MGYFPHLCQKKSTHRSQFSNNCQQALLSSALRTILEKKTLDIFLFFSDISLFLSDIIPFMWNRIFILSKENPLTCEHRRNCGLWKRGSWDEHGLCRNNRGRSTYSMHQTTYGEVERHGGKGDCQQQYGEDVGGAHAHGVGINHETAFGTA